MQVANTNTTMKPDEDERPEYTGPSLTWGRALPTLTNEAAILRLILLSGPITVLRASEAPGTKWRYWGVAEYELYVTPKMELRRRCIKPARRSRRSIRLAEADAEAMAAERGCIVVQGLSVRDIARELASSYGWPLWY